MFQMPIFGEAWFNSIQCRKIKKRTLFYDYKVYIKMKERNQNEKTNKKRIPQNTRLHGWFSISVVGTSELRKYW